MLLVPVRSLPEGAGVVQSNRVRGKMRDDDAAAVLRGGDLRLAFRFAHLPAPSGRVRYTLRPTFRGRSSRAVTR